MNIYELLKSGMTTEEVFRMYKDEIKDAQTRLAKEETERKAAEEARLKQEQEAKEAVARVEALKAEARAHIINGCVAYTEAFGDTVSDEEVANLEHLLIDMEETLAELIALKKDSASFDIGALFRPFNMF